MKSSALVSLFVVAVLMYSCGQNEAGGAQVQSTAPAEQAVGTTVPQNTAAGPVLPGNNLPAAPIIANANVNPAHGKPGHRCDIAVGAPLPSTTAFTPNKLQNPTSPVITAPVQNTPAPVTQAVAPTTVAAGMNPAHGQPNHRCDIPVGQPLNSKPAPTPTASTTPNKTVTPSPLKPDTLFAKGLNPAHGQPGHRCDIAVGQPLKGTDKKS